MTEFFLENKTLIAFISLPITSGFVGWVTNKLAIQMTFYPIKFFGIPPYLGWQGVIPRKSHKMASKGIDLLTERIIDIDEMFDQADPKAMAKEMSQPVEEVVSSVVEDVGHSLSADVWTAIPNAAKKAVVDQVAAQAPDMMTDVVKDFKAKILKKFDLKSYVLDNLTGENVKLLVDLFQRCGGPEFKFIEKSGLVLGFVLGIVQTAVWAFYNEVWTLPLIGIVVGYFTNWLALKMIFRPQHEKRYFYFFKWQGLFHKRQKEVSKEYAYFYATEVLTPKKVMDEVMYGKQSGTFFPMIRGHIIKAISTVEGLVRPFFYVFSTGREYDAIRSFIVERITSIVPKATRQAEPYLGQVMDLENTLYERMSELPSEEFEGLLRTAFQEDEIILIMVGAFLGFGIGLLQAFILA